MFIQSDMKSENKIQMKSVNVHETWAWKGDNARLF